MDRIYAVQLEFGPEIGWSAFAPQVLRVPVSLSRRGRGPCLWLFALLLNTFRIVAALWHDLDRLQIPAAYPVALVWKRGGARHGVNIRSAGLRTAAGPRFRTWV